MNKNQIFNNLLHLSGIANETDKILNLLQERGYQVSANQLRNWRRGVENRHFRHVPDYALEIIFDYLFEQKRNHQGYFTENK
ncbi:hypothetical protein C8D76_11018 [Pasteurella langaaensis DSM 22999]|uniref:Uncharacterized protein n=1 Tax=Alitibacter langaaensis DSM 22999 TaxID=1122935 RepID=A0A2U0SNR4_9PAST|nr:hypothetical protein [Pasteurella langaaensis]PVX32993.1 hypothetical protein C8D76_11018 [Pasteurella langaaensis DSM 22999]